MSANAVLSSIDAFSTSDVLFLFPNPPHAPRCLWGNSTRLAKESSYFSSLFDGGFSEGSAGITLELIPCALAAGEDESLLDADDSDDDTGDPLKAAVTPLPTSIRRVVVRDTSYKVYRSLLYFLATEQIAFAHLRSKRRRSASSGLQSQLPAKRAVGAFGSAPSPTPFAAPPNATFAFGAASLPAVPPPQFGGPFPPTSRPTPFYMSTGSSLAGTSQNMPQNTSSPPAPPQSTSTSSPFGFALSTLNTPEPVSPKSMFILADKLMISMLRARALVAFQAQLNADNVLDELMCAAVDCHHELREAAMVVAMVNWTKIVKQSDFSDLMQKAGSGDLSPAQVVSVFELFRRVAGGT
ncbi:hypothetical protein P7C70_g6363, partial [Phenoliferia sp. Uapishka_3]